MTKKVAIIDYGLGNLFSIKQALSQVGVEPIITRDKMVIQDCHGILLPGVGAYVDAMNLINRYELNLSLHEQARQGKPLLGVCLGFQLLFEKSYEFGETLGLGFFQGDVVRFPDTFNNQKLKVPFIGWNNLEINTKHKLFEDIDNNDKFYFVHSYYVDKCDDSNVLAYCKYNDFRYPAIFNKANITGVQGHPEKSGIKGLKFYSNWINCL